jgi:hypothetical protein
MTPSTVTAAQSPYLNVSNANYYSKIAQGSRTDHLYLCSMAGRARWTRCIHRQMDGHTLRRFAPYSRHKSLGQARHFHQYQPIPFIMVEWIDYTPDLQKQPFCTRILCWPCQCGLALSNTFLQCDPAGFCTILCCCPCRTLCGLFPTACEHEDEPATMPYTRVSQN